MTLLKGGLPKRLIVAIMIFVACFTSFMLRVNMSISLLAMVHPTVYPTEANDTMQLDDQSTISNESSITNATMNNSSEAIYLSEKLEVPNYGPRYEWDQGTQGRILGAYFYGFMFTSLPAGLLAERFGPKLLVTFSFSASAIATALTPMLAEVGPWYVIASRAIVGVLAGFVYPALHNLISRWIPPNERGKVIACIAGGSTFGTVITWPIAGILTEKFGWAQAFYAPAVFILAVGVIWALLITDTPDKHRTITPTERKLIEDSFGNTISKTKSWPPLGKVLTSLPYLALMLLHYGNIWGMSFFITQAPKFMNEVLGFKLANAGFLSSLPYLARMFSGFFFGLIGDVIRQKDLMSTTAVRKFFCLFSHIIPGIFLIVLPFIAQDALVCVACIVACLGFNGSSTITNLVNAQDLAPNFAATLYGFLNFLGTTTGFIAPMLVAFFTSEKNTIAEWKYVFLISAGIYIVSGLIFMVFGSGKVQKWNEIKPKSTSSSAVAKEKENGATSRKNSLEIGEIKRLIHCSPSPSASMVQ
ncbi:sialin-like [Topomyia yanbarensis]|uniref:sialin-like n=1 Tax=Topomyia yanbarensis TaxID=2498891 RepID=UPI00273B7890|nr:sialin-like [Topomyia yanbarensis]XP_058830780.1 sialin-like [Topomyia yanbarensis]XP_058830781.1 sialin-like [Topomyia yanbarensis]